MKKLLNFLYVLSIFIALAIIYFKSDSYVFTITQTTRDYLDSYLERLINNGGSNIEFKELFVKLLVLYVGYRIIKSMMFKRLVGLSLKERKGDWILNIWYITINLAVWTVLYNAANFFKVNTDKWMESFNLIIFIVIAGVICKIISVYQYYVDNMQK